MQLLEQVFKYGCGGVLCAALLTFALGRNGGRIGITPRLGGGGGVGAGFAALASKLSARLK